MSGRGSEGVEGLNPVRACVSCCIIICTIHPFIIHF